MEARIHRQCGQFMSGRWLEPVTLGSGRKHQAFWLLIWQKAQSILTTYLVVWDKILALGRESNLWPWIWLKALSILTTDLLVWDNISVLYRALNMWPLDCRKHQAFRPLSQWFGIKFQCWIWQKSLNILTTDLLVWDKTSVQTLWPVTLGWQKAPSILTTDPLVRDKISVLGGALNLWPLNLAESTKHFDHWATGLG